MRSYKSFQAEKRVSVLFWRGGLWPQARGALVPSTEKLWVGNLQTGILGCGQGQQAGPEQCTAVGGASPPGPWPGPQCLLHAAREAGGQAGPQAGPEEEPTFCFLPLSLCSNGAVGRRQQWAWPGEQEPTCLQEEHGGRDALTPQGGEPTKVPYLETHKEHLPGKQAGGQARVFA